MSIAVAGATGLVGRALTFALRKHGHTVVPLSRAHGVDLLTDERLKSRLTGVTTIIDVTNSPNQEQGPATAFFTTVAGNLGKAAGLAHVQHLIVLSIIGVDLLPGGYFVAKHQQELATRKAFAGAVVLRAAQFHEFAEQSLGWGRDGDRCLVPDMPVQPVALSAVVDDLVARAVSPGTDDEIAGPQQESLPEMVGRLVATTGDPMNVIPQEVDLPTRNGGLLPGPGAKLVGPTFGDWLAARSPLIQP